MSEPTCLNTEEVEREWQAAKAEHTATMAAETQLSCGTDVTIRKDGTLEIGPVEVDGNELLQFWLKSLEP